MSWGKSERRGRYFRDDRSHTEGQACDGLEDERRMLAPESDPWTSRGSEEWEEGTEGGGGGDCDDDTSPAHSHIQYSPSSVLRSMSRERGDAALLAQGNGMGVFLGSFLGRLYSRLSLSLSTEDEEEEEESAELASVEGFGFRAEREGWWRRSSRQERNLLVVAKPHTFLLSLVVHQRAMSATGTAAC